MSVITVEAPPETSCILNILKEIGIIVMNHPESRTLKNDCISGSVTK
jgi:hypothetical protein